jgi:hypothetical protein
MNRPLHAVLLCLASAFALPLAAPAGAAPPTARAYAPENLRSLSRDDQARVIGLEYSEQSNGRRIPDDQLRFYLDQINRSNWGFSQVKQDIARSLGGGGGTWPPPGNGDSIRCESDNGRSRTCPTPWQGGSRLVRQLSDTACVEGRTWQSQRGQVYVSGGCRGEFAAGGNAYPPVGSDSIRCESDDKRPRTCATPWQGGSRLVRQLSDTACIEGRTWQSQRGQVYVSGGCRGEFAAGGNAYPPVGGDNVRCESDNGRARTCPTPWQGGSRLVRQLSDTACVEGRTWQSQRGQVYVSGGCRGEFAAGGDWSGDPGNGYSVTCASTGNRSQSCAWNSRYGRPYLLQQLSSSPCRENGTWWYEGNAIRVSNGCRARFGAR